MSQVGPVSASAIEEHLYAIQVAQWKHDERYHRDITILPVQSRLKHMALHMSKYTGQIAGAIREANVSLLKRSFVDIFIIGVASVNALGLRLSKLLPLDSFHGANLMELGRHLADCHETWNDADLVFRVAESVGHMAKACESLDHLEPFPYRETIQQCLAELISFSLIAATQRGMDLAADVTERLKKVEEKHIFHQELCLLR